MILSQTAQYALRIMTNIALAPEGQLVRAKEIAEAIGCPQHYVSKVLRKLVTAGLLKGERGHGGGFLLSRSPEKILFCHVLDAVQGPKEAKQCIFGWRRCSNSDPCILHHRWTAVSGSFDEWARTTSLAEIKNEATESNWLVRKDEG